MFSCDGVDALSEKVDKDRQHWAGTQEIPNT